MRISNAAVACGALAATLAPFAAFGQMAAAPSRGGSRLQQVPITLDAVPRLHVTTRGRIILDETEGGGLRGPCPPTTSSHTDADFTGGSFVVQAGFAQQEIAAVSYTVNNPNGAALKINLMEFIFATSGAAMPTVTQYTIFVWAGNPNTGTIAWQESSDDQPGGLPHIRVGPGTAGVNVQVSVDPGDPEQIIVPGAAPTTTFSIGIRIDHHNQQTANPCTSAPPTCCNAFPVTDTSGLSQPTRNWLMGVNCGPFGCPTNGGWSTFANLASFCRPTGDWIMRATWETTDCQPATGSCCTNGTCTITTQALCVQGGGTYRGDGTNCSTPCPQPTGACCFQSTGGCINLTAADCASAGGIAGPAGSTCATHICFPTGACCLPNGNCIGPVSPTDCASLSGTFQGNGTACGTINCPLPSGACCFTNGACLVLTQADCTTAGATWAGAGTACPGGCTEQCRPDWDHNGTLEPADIAAFINTWFQSLQQGNLNGDYDGNGQVLPSDVGTFVGDWFQRLASGGC